MENLEFWNKYKEVPKNALKDFDNGKFKGTDINTMWRLKCLTETFGMCGVGWYFNIKKTWTETTPNGEMFAFAENIAIYHLFYVDTALCAVIYFHYRILQEVNRICTITASKKPFPYGQTAEKKK